MLYFVGYNHKVSLYCHVCNCWQCKQHFSIKCCGCLNALSTCHSNGLPVIANKLKPTKMFVQLRSSYCTFPNKNVLTINIVYSCFQGLL